MVAVAALDSHLYIMDAGTGEIDNRFLWETRFGIRWLKEKRFWVHRRQNMK